MSWYDEVKPYFVVARAYGLAPYAFVKGVPSNSRAYRVLMTIVFVVISSESSVFIYTNVTNESGLQIKILMALRGLVTSLAFITEGTVCVRSLDDLKSTMDDVEQYDRAVGVNFATRSVVVQAWSKLAVTAMYLVFLCIVRLVETKFTTLCAYYATRGFGWFAMVLKFTGVLSSFKRRFEHLCNIVTKGDF